MKTSELIGAALDWAVAKCEDETDVLYGRLVVRHAGDHEIGDSEWPYAPSTNWAQGGPIIEREGISVIKLEPDYGVDSEGYTTSERIPVFGAVTGKYFDTDRLCNSYGENYGEIYYMGKELVTTGPTPLTAAMRCYVASKLGDEVDVPKELV